MQSTMQVSLTQPLVRALLTLALLMTGYCARAQTPLAPETVLVAASDAPAPTQQTFKIAGSTDLTVTFTDLQTPAALSAASVAVTQGASLVSMTSLAAGATTATLSLHAAVGQYTLRVIATPNASATPAAGSFSVCVAPTATPKACIADASITGSVAAQSSAADPTVSTQSLTLTVVTAGSYTFTYADVQFPVALHVPPTLALFQGSTALAVPIAPSPATITLAAGTYTLLAFAQADPVAQAGLYGIVVSGPALVAPLVNSIYPVGLLAPASTASNPSTQSVALTVTDFAFPAALTGARAVITEGGTVLGSAAAGAGASSFVAPAGVLQVWSEGTGTGAGTYEVDLTANSVSLLQSVAGVNGGGALAYGFVTPKALAAGSYQVTANDFEFPSALSSLQFAVAQNGAVLKQQTGAGSLAFTAAAGPVVLLVAATPVTGGYGLVDVNVQTGGTSPQLEYDQIQPVGASMPFTPQPISIGTSGHYVVTLADLQFPSQFGTLALIGTSNGAVLGKVYAGGTFDLAATPGNYQFFIVAIPAAQQQYGLYGLQVLDAPPTVTLTASPTSVVTGGSTTLSWTTTNSATCTGTGGTFTGNQAATGSGSAMVTVAATTTYMLKCTGPGGSAENSVTVTATPAPPPSSGGGGGGGGGIGAPMLGMLGLLVLGRLRPIIAPRRSSMH